MGYFDIRINNWKRVSEAFQNESNNGGATVETEGISTCAGKPLFPIDLLTIGFNGTANQTQHNLVNGLIHRCDGEFSQDLVPFLKKMSP